MKSGYLSWFFFSHFSPLTLLLPSFLPFSPCREGYGHLCSPKEEYKGEWKNNIKHGFGLHLCFFYAFVFVLHFSNTGSLIDHEKNQYTGQFENDLFHGKGGCRF